MKAVLFVAVLALVSAAQAGEILFSTNALWRYRLGTQEASQPMAAWRGVSFNDAAWAEGPGPIGYSTATPRTGVEAEIRTFLPTSTQSNYTTVYFRKSFVLTNMELIKALKLTLHIDDGAVAWLNGIEVARVNAPSGELPYFARAMAGDETIVATALIPSDVFVEGTNVLAVHGLNTFPESSDFVFAAVLETVPDEPPRIAGVAPPMGATINSVRLIEVVFDEATTGVDASDLLVNGVPATSVTSNAPNDYVFHFNEPPPGPVEVAFAANHNIRDTDATPTPFAGANWTYMLDTNTVANVWISEFLADNSANIEDEDGDNSDWIEIYNAGPDYANLSGWYLTDDPARPARWQFPTHVNVTVGPNRYLLVWASGKNKTNDIARLHTNFRLERSGEYLALLGPDLRIVSEFAPAYPRQFTDNSYGRDRVDWNLVGYYTVPTPGGQNAMSGPGFSEGPAFSVASGLFTSPSITVTITGRGNPVIRYTLDGNEPTNGSPVYGSALTFSNNAVIKARAFEPGLWPSPIVARTYHFLDPSVQDFSSKVPIVIINTSGRAIRAEVPGGGNRVRGSFVVIDTFRGRSTMQTTPQFQGLAQFELYGQTALGMDKKPYRVEVNDELGNDIDVSLLGLPPEADFQLEVKMSDKSFLNGFLAHEMHQMMGHYAPRRRFVEVFADTGGGKIKYPDDYVGVYELTEKIERDRNRVDIAELTPSHTTEPEITGGYIFKKDKDSFGDLNFRTPTMNGFVGLDLKIHEPKPRFITPQQFAYLSNYLRQFTASLTDSNWLQLTGTNHYSHYIDVDSFVDQHWIVEYTRNIDGYRLSRFWSKDRGGKIVDAPIWDFDLCFGNANYLDAGKTNGWYWTQIGDIDHTWQRRLLTGTPSAQGTSGDPVFIQKVIDRWGELRTNVFANERVLERVDTLATLLQEAAVRNYAKYTNLNVYVWPNPDGPPIWDVNYATQTTYPSLINEVKKWITGRFNWLDAQFVRAPQINHDGGLITQPVQLVINAPTGTVYYTTDGTDPRAPSGAVAGNALVYSGAITIEESGAVFARARVGTNQYSWSPPAFVTFYSRIPGLRITEIMYHPVEDGLEYLVVENVSGQPLNLGGFKFGGGVAFTFPGITLGGGGRAFVVENAAAFTAYYGTGRTIAGEYTGKLDNAGERLTLTGPLREPILDFSYDDAWWPSTDGAGFSLVIVDRNAPTSTWGDAASWRPSGGQDVAHVVINEVLSNPESGASDAIELHNLSGQNVDISGWYLSDDFDERKYRIPDGTVIPAGGYRVFQEAEFGFGLAKEGEEVFLFSANPDGGLSGYVARFAFGGQRIGTSVGRYVNSVGQEHAVAQRTQSFGAANAGPAIPDVVVSEIMYHPPVVFANGAYWNNTEDEFVELHNRGDTAVEMTGRLLKGAGISYRFGSTTIEPRGYLLVVSFDPVSNPGQLTSFRGKYAVPASVQVVGPFNGNLGNDGGALDEVMVLNDGTGGFETLLERIDYDDAGFWPATADGVGLSLHRADVNEYGNDPVNWTASPPSAGRGFAPGPAPVITQQPQDATVVAAETATTTFRVATAEANVRYQWFKNDDSIDGATNTTLTLNGVQPSDAGRYYVLVWNDSGVATSSNAVLTVHIGIRIDRQPQDITVQLGAEAKFLVLATSPSPITYQWRFNGVPIPQANDAELRVQNASEIKEGEYDVFMTDAVGSVLSTAARLKVLVRPEMTSPVPPLSLTASAGEMMTASARIRGTLPVYARWRWSTPQGFTFTLGDQIINDRVASFSFAVPTGIVGRVRVSLTNMVGGSFQFAATNAFVTVLEDSDGDHIPDIYERANGMDENNPNDAAADPDGDTMSNSDEYIAGTDPQDGGSYLRVERVEATGSATIYFRAISNRTYSVQYSDKISPALWERLQDVLARPTNYSAVVSDPESRPQRFYRLVTPPPLP